MNPNSSNPNQGPAQEGLVHAGKIERLRQALGNGLGRVSEFAGDVTDAVKGAAHEIAPDVKELFVEIGAPAVAAAVVGAGVETGLVRETRSGIKFSKVGAVRAMRGVAANPALSAADLAREAAQGAKTHARHEISRTDMAAAGKHIASSARRFGSAYRATRRQQKAV